MSGLKITLSNQQSNVIRQTPCATMNASNTTTTTSHSTTYPTQYPGLVIGSKLVPYHALGLVPFTILVGIVSLTFQLLYCCTCGKRYGYNPILFFSTLCKPKWYSCCKNLTLWIAAWILVMLDLLCCAVVFLQGIKTYDMVYRFEDANLIAIRNWLFDANSSFSVTERLAIYNAMGMDSN